MRGCGFVLLLFCLFEWLLVCVFVCLFARLRACLLLRFVCLFVCWSVCVSVHVSSCALSYCRAMLALLCGRSCPCMELFFLLDRLSGRSSIHLCKYTFLRPCVYLYVVLRVRGWWAFGCLRGCVVVWFVRCGFCLRCCLLALLFVCLVGLLLCSFVC